MPRETSVPNVTEEKARKQLDELYAAENPSVEAAEAPKGAAPGSHPLCPISGDAEAMAALFFADPADLRSKRAVWDLTAYGAPVLHYY